MKFKGPSFDEILNQEKLKKDEIERLYPKRKEEKKGVVRLTEKEATLYQDYATTKEGKEFSEQANKQSYKEAEKLIDEIRAAGVNFDEINLGNIDLTNALGAEDANQRLAGALNLLAEKTNDKTILEKLREIMGTKYGSAIAACIGLLTLLSTTVKKLDAAEIKQVLRQGTEFSAQEEKRFHLDKFLEGFGATLYSPHYQQNAGGSFKRENLWKFMLEPAAVGLKYESRQDRQLQISVPYKYARQFNLAEQQNPSDREKMIQYIKEEMERELAAKFLAFSWDEETLKEKRPDFVKTDNLKITNIEIIGSASPEASARGSEQPGNVDQKNLSLAELRARKAKTIKEESLKQMQIKNEGNYQLEGIEDQFNPEEMAVLNEMAVKYDTDIFGLIKMYNKNEIKDSEDKGLLDESIASKRAVIYLDDVEGGAPRVLVVPLPIFVVLGAIGGREIYRIISEWRRRRREQRLTEEESMRIAAISGDVYDDISSGQNFYSKLAIDLSGEKVLNSLDKEGAVVKIAERIIEEWEKADAAEASRANVKASPDYKYDENKKLYSIFHALVVREMAQKEKSASRKGSIKKVSRGMSIERQEFGKEIEKIIFKEFGYYAKDNNLRKIIDRLTKQIEQSSK